MIQIDEQTLRCIISLKNRNNDFQAFTMWLKLVHGQTISKSIRQKDIECHWTQGKAQGFGELLTIIESSEGMLAERKKVASQPEGVRI